MSPDLQRRVQRYGWDKAVKTYERDWGEQLAPSQRLLLEAAALKPGEIVADIACGTGLVSFPAADAVAPSGRVVGTDISGGMVERAGRRAKEWGRTNISFERTDAEALSLPDGMFDVALSSLGIMYYPSPVDAMREMHRILRPGGRAVVSTWGERANCGWADIFPIVDSRVNTDVCPLFFREGTGENLRTTLQDAGFVEVALQRLRTTLHYDSFEAAAEAVFIGGPVAMAFSRFDERTAREAFEEYRRSIAPFRNGEGYDIPGEFVVGRGRRPED